MSKCSSSWRVSTIGNSKKKCVLCILQSAHFEYTKFFSSLNTSSSCSVLYLHWQFFCVSVIPSGHNPQPAIRCHSSRGWSKKHHGGNIQVGSFQQIKLVRHFQVLVWVCLKMKEQSNSHVTFWFQNLEIVSFLGFIDFDTSKGYNLSTCISRIWVSGSDLQIDHTNLRPRRSQRVNESMNRRIGGTVAPHPLWHSICNTLRIAWCLLRIPQSTLAVERWPITRLWAPSELICLHAMQHFVTKPTPEWLNDPGYLNLQSTLGFTNFCRTWCHFHHSITKFDSDWWKHSRNPTYHPLLLEGALLGSL